MGGLESASATNPKIIAGNKIISAAGAELVELDRYKKAGSPEAGAAVFIGTVPPMHAYDGGRCPCTNPAT